MFKARLLCENCGFKTTEFFTSYFPPGDQLDLVFQNSFSFEFRIVHGILGAGKNAYRVTEEEAECLEKILVAKTNRPNEERVIVFESQFHPRNCPSCKQKSSVKLDHTGIA